MVHLGVSFDRSSLVHALLSTSLHEKYKQLTSIYSAPTRGALSRCVLVQELSHAQDSNTSLVLDSIWPPNQIASCKSLLT